MSEPIAARSPAGFWKRYVAYFFDWAFVSIAAWMLMQPFVPRIDAADQQRVQAILTATLDHEVPDQAALEVLVAHMVELLGKLMTASAIAYVVVGCAYFTICESSRWQASFGKRLVGIKVVSADGARIGPLRAAARFFAAGLSWATLNIGHAMAAIAPGHRALHDLVAGTRVENEDPLRPGMPGWGWAVVAFHALVLALVILAGVGASLLVLGQAAQA